MEFSTKNDFVGVNYILGVLHELFDKIKTNVTNIPNGVTQSEYVEIYELFGNFISKLRDLQNHELSQIINDRISQIEIISPNHAKYPSPARHHTFHRHHAGRQNATKKINKQIKK